MRKLNRGDKIYLDKENTIPSMVNSYTNCRDGIIHCYEYNDASGYGNKVRLFLCENTKHESMSIIRQAYLMKDNWDEEVLTFDSDSFVFLKALISYNEEALGGIFTVVRDYSNNNNIQMEESKILDSLNLSDNICFKGVNNIINGNNCSMLNSNYCEIQDCSYVHLYDCENVIIEGISNQSFYNLSNVKIINIKDKVFLQISHDTIYFKPLKEEKLKYGKGNILYLYMEFKETKDLVKAMNILKRAANTLENIIYKNYICVLQDHVYFSTPSNKHLSISFKIKN